MKISHFLQKLKSTQERQRSVLVLNGTGVNFWHYRALLSHFTLAQLCEFSAIYSISGAGGGLMFYVLEQMGELQSKRMRRVDFYLRKNLNHRGLGQRIYSLFKKDFVYATSDLRRFAQDLISADAAKMAYQDFPLKNFSMLAHDEEKNQLLMLRPEKDLRPMLDLFCSAGLPRRIGNRPFCQGLPGLFVSDYDFAGITVKKEFQRHLKEKHADQHIYHLNIYFSAGKQGASYVKASRARYPRFEQFTDFLLAFLNIPNSNPARTYFKKLPGQKR